MKCPQCGRENRSSAGYCAWCGERLPQESAAPQPEPVAVTTAPLPAEPLPAATPPANDGTPGAGERTRRLARGASATDYRDRTDRF